jgi:hypothetical protein
VDDAELILSYLDAVRFLERKLVEARSAETPGEALWDLVVSVRSDEEPYEADLTNAIRYQVHGFGAFFELASGEVLNVDARPESKRVSFDAWRVQQFIRDRLDGHRPERDGIERSLQALVGRDRLIESAPGWFSLPDGLP